MMDTQNELKKIEIEFDKLMQNLSDRVYKEYIIPFCKKYKIRFKNGMGTYIFVDIKTDKILYPEYMIKSKKQEKLKEIIDILDRLTLNINSQVSWYLNDVK